MKNSEIPKVRPEPPACILCWGTLLEKKKRGREIEGDKILKNLEIPKVRLEPPA